MKSKKKKVDQSSESWFDDRESEHELENVGDFRKLGVTRRFSLKTSRKLAILSTVGD